MVLWCAAGVVAPKPAEEAAPLQASQTAKQKDGAAAKLGSLKAEANGNASELLVASICSQCRTDFPCVMSQISTQTPLAIPNVNQSWCCLSSSEAWRFRMC